MREKTPCCISQAIWGHGLGKEGCVEWGCEQLQALQHIFTALHLEAGASQRLASGKNQDVLPSDIWKQSMETPHWAKPAGQLT